MVYCLLTIFIIILLRIKSAIRLVYFNKNIFEYVHLCVWDVSVHSAFEGALTFVSEPKLGHSAFHYPRLGNLISLFNKI